MRLKGTRLALTAGVLVCLAQAVPSQAAVYAPIADDELVRRAPAMAVVESLGSTVLALPGKLPETRSTFKVVDILRGTLPEQVEVGVIGGKLPDGTELVVPGVPRFAAGRQYLLALSPREDGSYGVVEQSLGAFDVVQDGKGRLYATRMVFRGAATPPSSRINRAGVVAIEHEPLRDFGNFVAFVRSAPVGSLSNAAPSYLAANRTDLRPAGASGPYSPLWDSRWCADGTMTCANPISARWTNNASASLWWCDEDASTLGEGGVDGGGLAQFTQAMQFWDNTAPQANINLSRGVDCVTYECCGDPSAYPPRGQIKFYLDDLSQPEFQGSPISCPLTLGGVLGIGSWLTDGSTHTWKGQSWKSIAAGVGWVRKASCGTTAYPANVYTNIITQMIGTTLGLSNADLSINATDTIPTDDADAIMVTFLSIQRGTGLGADDVAGACYLYGNCSSSGTVNTTLFVPVVLSVAGKGNSVFSSEMTVTNSGPLDASIVYQYVPSLGQGAGSVTDSLAAGKQTLIPDAIAYLRQKGLAIPSNADALGTILASFSGLSATSDAGIAVRTTTPVPPTSPNGRAGLAYAGVPAAKLLTTLGFLVGLRQNAQDRTNVAFENAGVTGSGDITLKATYYAGDGSGPISPPYQVTISPGGWVQVALTDIAPNAVQGYVKVEKVGGTAPFWTYAVINDNLNSDGSYILPINEFPILCQTCKAGLTLPVAVETGSYITEVILTNVGDVAKSVPIMYVAKAITGGSTTVSFTLPPHSQLQLPSFVQVLRDMHAPGVGPVGPAFLGAVFVLVPGPGLDTQGIAISGRVTNPGPVGYYGVFCQGAYNGYNATGSAWLSILRKDSENRANLAIVNTGELDTSSSDYLIETFDGVTGAKAGQSTATLRPFEWMQFDQVLNQISPSVSLGYARVTRMTGQNPFISYAVVNDGANPGDRSGDGAFVPYVIP